MVAAREDPVRLSRVRRRVSNRRFAEVRYPWSAAVERDSPQPARFYTALIGQAMRYGLPATRRPAWAWVLGARVGAPERAMAGAIRRLPGSERPDLNDLLDRVTAAWPDLAARARNLPPTAPQLSALALQRSAALTVFAFGAGERPLLVLKIPAAGDDRVDREVQWLEAAEAAGVSPRPLGRLGDARVQEGLPGIPLEVEPLGPERASSFAWTGALGSAAEGMSRIGAATAKEGPPEEIAEAIGRALEFPDLDEGARRALAAAWRHVSASDTSVLRHRDTSPQNCLMQHGRLSGVVDWEMAVARGGPGYDVLNLALSYLEYGVGLTRWSDARVLATFSAAWRDSGFWHDGREAARRAALAAGASEADLEPLEIAFFGSRIGDRLVRPGWHPYGAATAARELEVVCRG